MDAHVTCVRVHCAAISQHREVSTQHPIITSKSATHTHYDSHVGTSDHHGASLRNQVQTVPILAQCRALVVLGFAVRPRAAGGIPQEVVGGAGSSTWGFNVTKRAVWFRAPGPGLSAHYQHFYQSSYLGTAVHADLRIQFCSQRTATHCCVSLARCVWWRGEWIVGTH